MLLLAPLPPPLQLQQLYLLNLSVGQQIWQLRIPVQERKGKEGLQSIWMIQLTKCLQVLFKGKFIFQTEHKREEVILVINFGKESNILGCFKHFQNLCISILICFLHFFSSKDLSSITDEKPTYREARFFLLSTSTSTITATATTTSTSYTGMSQVNLN